MKACSETTEIPTPERAARRRTTAAWLWTALVVAVCWAPGRWVHRVERGHVEGSRMHLDKVVHLAAFAGFGLLWTRALPGKRSAALILIAAAALAVITELGQAMPIVDRDPDLLDALADLAGAAGGIGIGQLIKCRDYKT